jgi:hypothetical protein
MSLRIEWADLSPETTPRKARMHTRKARTDICAIAERGSSTKLFPWIRRNRGLYWQIFLHNKSDAKRQVSDLTSPAYIVWVGKCGLSSTTTVRQCFEKDRPLTAPGFPLTSGAVYSLLPNGTCGTTTPCPLQNPKLPGPNIGGAD